MFFLIEVGDHRGRPVIRDMIDLVQLVIWPLDRNMFVLDKVTKVPHAIPQILWGIRETTRYANGSASARQSKCNLIQVNANPKTSC